MLINSVEYDFKPGVKTVLYVGYKEIERLINHYFRNEKHIAKDSNYSKNTYGLPCIEERGNYEDWNFVINGLKDSYDEDTIQEVFEGNWPDYCTTDLLEFLAFHGKIPCGEYVVSIFW
jgi:hypothetical protein